MAINGDSLNDMVSMRMVGFIVLWGFHQWLMVYGIYGFHIERITREYPPKIINYQVVMY